MYQNEIQLAREALWLVLLLSAPPILAAAITGLLIAFLQAVTPLQEQTFPYAVKCTAVVLALFATATVLGGTLYNYSDNLFSNFATLIR